MLERSITMTRKIIREIASLVIRFSGIPFIIRNTLARNKVTIVLYHSPKPDVLDRHLSYLSKRFSFISLDLLVNAIHARDWTSIPQKSLIITLDDGYKENFDLLGVFKKYKVVPTIYFCSQIIDTNRNYWFKINGVNLKRLKQSSDIERIQILDKEYGFKLTGELSEQERQALNKREILLMKDFVDFQSHSRFHPILTTCKSNVCKEEIIGSKKELETLLGKECNHFSYPNGDYADREIGLLKEAGYLSARTIDVGWNGPHTDPYKLKITGITDDASVNMVAAQLSGLTMYIRYLINGSVHGKHPTIKHNGTQK